MVGTHPLRLPAMHMMCVLIGALAGQLVAAAETQERRAEFLNPPQAQRHGFPFSEAVRAGDLLFLSGQVGSTGDTMKLVPGGIVPEARQTLRNIENALKRYGYSLADVVKCTVFLADISEWNDFNKVYREFFKAPYPARSALGANGLALNARVELECIAYAPQPR
jgi:2-iminobutanoate/2-iminopropanoate deaminase